MGESGCLIVILDMKENIMPNNTQIEEAIRKAKREDLVDFKDFKERISAADNKQLENIAREALNRKDQVQDKDRPPSDSFIALVESLVEQIKDVIRRYY
jgi:hypothetical protein